MRRLVVSRDTIIKKKFEVLFREHFTGLCYFAHKYTGDLDSSKEVVHSVFIRLWENRHSFDWEKPAKSYLFTSVYNRSLNFIRDKKRFINRDDLTDPLHVEEAAYNDHLEIAELESLISSSLQRLPEKCRKVFEMSRFEGKKYAEIAEHLDISLKTVETHMSKALHILKEALKDYLMVVILLMFKNMNRW